jgi:hypothetical protein
MSASTRSPLRLNAVLLALALPFAAFAAATPSTGMTKEQYDSNKKQISDTYKTDKKACDSQSGNAKDVCKKEAEAKEKNAKADLEFNYSGKQTDQEKATKVHAETAYDVAKEKCDDQKGNDKDVCVKTAKADKDKALADLKAGQKTAKAENAATKEKNDADYAVAKEKCDSLAGDAKSKCQSDAKAQYGK